ncbi:MAG TPA: hypothetical protein VF989_15540 [Polyangiaceae bacterium]|jgi:hypothetical protein
MDPGEQLDRGALARAVGTDVRDELAPFHFEAHAIEGVYLAVTTLHQRAERSQDARLALEHSKALTQPLHHDLRHGSGAAV